MRSVAAHVDSFFVIDTGSTDATIPILEKLVSYESDGFPPIYLEQVDTDRDGAMKTRDAMVTGELEEEDRWIMILDADEIYHPDTLDRIWQYIDNDGIDYIGYHPIAFGENPRCCEDPTVFLGPDPTDKERYGAVYWCHKYTIRLIRRTACTGLVNCKWGKECFVTEFDPDWHNPTEDHVPGKVPDGMIEIQATGRTKWLEEWYWHATCLRRSSVEERVVGERHPRRPGAPRSWIPDHIPTPPEVERVLGNA